MWRKGRIACLNTCAHCAQSISYKRARIGILSLQQFSTNCVFIAVAKRWLTCLDERRRSQQCAAQSRWSKSGLEASACHAGIWNQNHLLLKRKCRSQLKKLNCLAAKAYKSAFGVSSGGYLSLKILFGQKKKMRWNRKYCQCCIKYVCVDPRLRNFAGEFTPLKLSPSTLQYAEGWLSVCMTMCLVERRALECIRPTTKQRTSHAQKIYITSQVLWSVSRQEPNVGSNKHTAA